MRGVRVTWLIAVGVVFAVICGPANRSTFAGENTAEGKGVLDPVWYDETGMGEKSVVSQADTEATVHPVEDHTEDQAAPCEGPRGGERTDVQGDKPSGSSPLDSIDLGDSGLCFGP